MDPRRTERFSEAMRTELEELINYELDDPRLIPVSVTEVLLSPDGKKAHIRLALDGGADEQAQCMEAIENAKAYLRHQLAARVEIFRMPDLRFDADVSAGLRAKAPQLLKRMRKGRSRSEDPNGGA